MVLLHQRRPSPWLAVAALAVLVANGLAASCDEKLRLPVQVALFVDEILFIEPTRFRAVVSRVATYTEFEAAARANGTRIVWSIADARAVFWDPQLRFSNLDGGRSSEEVLENRFEVRPTGQVIITERVLATFRHSLDLTLFPLDEQDLPISVAPSVCNSDEVTLSFLEEESGTVAFDDGMVHLWHLAGHSISSRTVVRGSPLATSSARISLSEVTLSVKVRRSATSVVKGYVLPTQLLVFGSWASFWLPPEKPIQRMATPWFALLVWVNLQGRVLSYNLPQTIQNTLADWFTWSMALLLFGAVFQNGVICAVARFSSRTIAEEFDTFSKLLFPLVLAVFWAMAFITLGGIEGLRSKTAAELSGTFDILEGIFVAILGVAFLVSSTTAVYVTRSFPRRLITLFVEASPHMYTEPTELGILFQYIAGRSRGRTAFRRRAYIQLSEIDEAMHQNGVKEKVRADLRQAFKKQVREPTCISKSDFIAIWGQLTQLRYEHFRHGPNERDFTTGSPKQGPDNWWHGQAEGGQAQPPPPQQTVQQTPMPVLQPQSPQSNVMWKPPQSPTSEHSFSPTMQDSVSQQGGPVQDPYAGAQSPHGQRPPSAPPRASGDRLTPQRGRPGPLSPAGSAVASQSSHPYVASD